VALPQQLLSTVTGAFNQVGSAPNTAWGADPRTGQIVLTLSDAAPSAVRTKLTQAAERFGRQVRVEHVRGEFTQQSPAATKGRLDKQDALYGGDRLASSDRVCSVGFNVQRNDQKYVLTAGHCTKGDPEFNGVGPSVASTFPDHDYGLVRNEESDAVGGVNRYDGSWQRIDRVGQAYTGEKVCKSGQSSGLTCGRVTALDQTVNYGNGTVVHGLVRTNTAAENGDSGCPLFDESAGIGTLSGGNGHTEFFQPLAPAMQEYDVQLLSS
jgi:streptogrisin D